MTSLVTVFYTTGAAHLKGAVAAEHGTSPRSDIYPEYSGIYVFLTWPCMDNRAADTTALER